jgi:CheY-like chemotaxis protein
MKITATNPGRILVVDASADCRELMRAYLRALGYPAPIEAADGEEALARAAAEKPELILTEIRLPKIDGFALVAALRRHPATRAACVIAATAWVTPAIERRCLCGGFDGYLPKPFTLADFRRTLASCGSHAP